jgi:hypothetical protein
MSTTRAERRPVIRSRIIAANKTIPPKTIRAFSATLLVAGSPSGFRTLPPGEKPVTSLPAA